MTLIHVPELELGVSGGRDNILAAEELDVGHGLAVTLEHVQGLLCGPGRRTRQVFMGLWRTGFSVSPEVIVVNTVIR